MVLYTVESPILIRITGGSWPLPQVTRNGKKCFIHPQIINPSISILYLTDNILNWTLFVLSNQSKRTKKVGVVGKYGTRYGSSVRKQMKKIETTQHAKYTCSFCGRDAVRRTAVGIWECRGCKKVVAGGAWTLG